MRKTGKALTALWLVSALLLAGCGAKKSAAGQDAAVSQRVLTPSAPQSAAPQSAGPALPAEGQTDPALRAEAPPEVDLVGQNSNMIYAQVYDMVTNPAQYLGKTVRIEGQFSVFHNDELQVDYYVVLISDAMACCQQGMEFIWPEHVYPDDYPKQGDTVQVTGTFEAYDENGTTYYHLRAGEVTVV